MAKILVVDDSGLARRTLNKILVEAGHEVALVKIHPHPIRFSNVRLDHARHSRI